MLKLKDGPVAGAYLCKRAPLWLRAVVDANGKKDVLDQLDDQPSATETVYVYRCVSEVGHVHINTARKSGRGFYVMADYEYIPDMDGELVRENSEWRAWCAIEGNTARSPEGEHAL